MVPFSQRTVALLGVIACWGIIGCQSNDYGERPPAGVAQNNATGPQNKIAARSGPSPRYSSVNSTADTVRAAAIEPRQASAGADDADGANPDGAIPDVVSPDGNAEAVTANSRRQVRSSVPKSNDDDDPLVIRPVNPYPEKAPQKALGVTLMPTM